MQGFLVRRRAALAEAGVTALTRRDLDRDPLLRQLRSIPRSGLRGLAAAWPLARTPGRTVVVSEEGLLGPMPGHRGAGFYPGHRGAIRAMERLGRVFEVSVCWIVRRQDRFLESVWAFRVGRGLVDDFPTFAAPLADALHWLPIARALAVARLDARVALFEALFAASGREARLGALLDLPADAVGRKPLRRVNVGLRGPLLHVLLHLNRHAPPPPAARRRVVDALRALVSDEVLPSAADVAPALEHAGSPTARHLVAAALAFASKAPAPGLDPNERQAFLARYEAGNRALCRMSILHGDRKAWETGVISSPG